MLCFANSTCSYLIKKKFMTVINDLQDLLIHLVTEIKNAEQQLKDAMPAIIEKANHRSLKNALQHHHQQTVDQLKRLQKIQQLLVDADTKTENRNCKGIAALVEETTELLSATIATEAIDPAIIMCVQKIEHYEICSYGTALAYAEQLQLHEVSNLLLETLDEEYAADDLLTALAKSAFNKEAAPEGIQVNNDSDETNNMEMPTGKLVINERTIQSPGGRAGTSHRGYSNSESRGH